MQHRNRHLHRVAAVVTALVAAMLAACPGSTDGIFEIKHPFYLTDTGSHTALLEKRDGTFHIVLNGRIDAAKVIGGEIVMAQTPGTAVTESDGTLGWNCGPVCEFWAANITTREVRRISPTREVSCSSAKSSLAPANHALQRTGHALGVPAAELDRWAANEPF